MPRRLILLCLALTGLAVLAAPAGVGVAATKKRPKITRVTPMRLEVGDRVTIRGRNFRPKRKRNTVIFRGVGGRQVLVKPIRASRRKLVVKVPRSVPRILGSDATRVKLRVLAGRFSAYTSPRLSPVVLPRDSDSGDGDGGGAPRAPAPVAPAPGAPAPGGSGGSGAPAPPACPGADGTVDQDGDLLENSREAQIGTNPCNKDSDGDGVEDGFEYKSALDLNDDEYQDCATCTPPNSSLPNPGQRPYPNPLARDAAVDHDGDSLTLAEEQALWKHTIVAVPANLTLTPLSYSAGEQYSIYTRLGNGRREPALAASGYDMQVAFLDWASDNDHYYRNVMLTAHGSPWYAPRASYGLLDFNRDSTESAGVPGGGAYRRTELTYYDFDRDTWLSDNERDEDADGLTNYDESHGRMQPGWWASCYSSERPHTVAYAGTSMLDPDSDNDGIRDGADDQDHDDIPNVMELSRIAASGLDDTDGPTCTTAPGLTSPNHPGAYGRVNPFNPCLPEVASRTCQLHPDFGSGGAPFDGSPDWYSLN
jgi:hypothetical protein